MDEPTERAPVRWNAELLWQSVVAFLPGFTIEIVPQIDSSNSELMRRARAGQTDPVLLVAERQLQGRGRLGRDWRSDVATGAGSLTFSLGLPLAPANWSGLSLVVGLALAESLHPELRIKWPNDIWLDERKLAGILIETVSAGDARYAVVGIGINLQGVPGDGLRNPAAGLQELLPQISAPQVLQRVLLPLVQALQQFVRQGFGARQSAFGARDALLGRPLVCSDGTQGVARGVDAQGALLLETDRGVVKISSAEVSVRPAA